MRINKTIVLTLLFMSTISQAQEQWEMFGDLKQRIVYPVVVRFQDNKALIMGGYVNELWGQAAKSVELLEYVNGVVTHTEVENMPTPHVEFPAVNFGDTLIVAIGGYTGSGVSNVVDAYDVRTGVWKSLGNLQYGRRQHVAYQLNNEEFIVVGGRHGSLSSMSYAEIFNIVTGESREVANFPHIINGGVAGLTSQGYGVVCAGREDGPDSPRFTGIYTYDQQNDTWVKVGDMSSGREAPTGYRMEDGSFVVVGGSEQENPPVRFIGDVVLEDNGSFRSKADIGYGITYCGVTEYRIGELLVVGGWLSNLKSTDRCTYVDAQTGMVKDAPKLNVPRRYTRSVTLVDPSTSKRVSFAIGGAGNAATTFTIEILDRECKGDFENAMNSADLRLYGDAAWRQDVVQITDTNSFSSGAAWYTGKVSIQSNFETTFSFRLSDGNDHNLKDGGPAGADGVVLVIQNEYPGGIGEAGRGIGYEGLPHGLAVEFDSYLNAEFGDSAGSHVAVQVGDGFKLSGNHAAPYLKGMTHTGVPVFNADGTVYHAKVEYGGAVLRVWIDTDGSFVNPVLEVPINVAAELGLGPDGRAWMGITSATGFSTERHELLSWSIGSCDPILVGVEDERPTPLNNQLRVVPQPSTDVAHLEFPGLAGEVTIQVMDVRGNEVFRASVDGMSGSISLPANTLSAGTYAVRVTTGSGVQTLLWSVLH